MAREDSSSASNLVQESVLVRSPATQVVYSIECGGRRAGRVCCCLSYQTAAKIILILTLIGNIFGFLNFGFWDYNLASPAEKKCSEDESFWRLICAILSAFFVPVDVLACLGIFQKKSAPLFPWITFHCAELKIISIIAFVMLFTRKSLIETLTCTSYSGDLDFVWRINSAVGISLCWCLWYIVVSAYYELKPQETEQETSLAQSNQNSQQTQSETLDQPPPYEEPPSYEVLNEQPPPYRQFQAQPRV